MTQIQVARLVPTHPHKLGRFIRFAIVGGIGTVVDFTLLVILKELFGFPTLLANTLSFSGGVINNFTLNRLWTYPDSRTKTFLAQLAQFLLVSVIGVLLNNLIVMLLEAPLGTLLNAPDSGYIPAKIIATMTVVFWNFFANRYWTFNDAAKGAQK